MTQPLPAATGGAKEKPAALLLLGPTASGKSAFSLRLAQAFDVEIISIDSALVYRGMDIGSAKPTAAELAAAPHHLIDIREISEPYSAADFVADASRLVPEIHDRGRFPIIVGGTMLYAKALREGISDMPTTPPEVRERILREGEAAGWPAMHARLAEVDPEAAARLAPNDKQRIGRALEVYEMTGRPLSSFHSGRTAAPPFPLLTVGLMPADRAKLHQRIEARFDDMLFQGFLDEAKRLMARSDFDPESPAMRAVGYRQAIDYLSGRKTFDEFRLSGIAATRQLAKRQMTWLRSMKDAVLIDPFEPGAYEALEALTASLAPKKPGS